MYWLLPCERLLLIRRITSIISTIGIIIALSLKATRINLIASVFWSTISFFDNFINIGLESGIYSDNLLILNDFTIKSFSQNFMKIKSSFFYFIIISIFILSFERAFKNVFGFCIANYLSYSFHFIVYY